MNIEQLYPAAPANVSKQVSEPNDRFRAQVRNVIIAIVAFLITYVLMVLAAVALAWVCLKAGIFVMLLGLHWLSLLIGAGIIVMGFLVVFFLIKFLFASNTGNEEPGIEVTEQEEPTLFAFIQKVADEVGAQHPKKVFLIPDVNASVFYQSSFWSLFLPTRKNLNIGLGLTNSLTLSGFKAVLAHEFGHFSQKSMSLGSYVYYVNRVIFNMLYNNTSWVSAANGLASISSIITFFVQLAVYIVQGVQWVLRSMYGIVNKQYLGLSREMEFHADTIAASVSGSNNMSQALRQVEFGAATYQQTIDKLNKLLNDKLAPRNAYVGQKEVASHLAQLFNLPVQKGIAIITRDFIESRQKSRINFKDQWASHPTREEREENLNALNLQGIEMEQSAWLLFQNPEERQQELTDFLYRNVDIKVDAIENETFVKDIREEQVKNDLPKLYRGYFDGHVADTSTWPEIKTSASAKAFENKAWEAFFAENLDDEIQVLHQDIEVLKAIQGGQIDTKSFDFDGAKYAKNQAHEVLRILEKDLETATELRKKRDAETISGFYAHAMATKPAQALELKDDYDALHEMNGYKEIFFKEGHEILVTFHLLAANDFYISTELTHRFKALHTEQMPALRRLFKEMPSLEWLPEAAQVQVREMFMGPVIEFNHFSEPHRTNIENLQTAVLEVGNAMGERFFARWKKVLELQAGMV
ncbi:MAG: M48 family metalloprotease [Saprospiraceae bacterium]|nr:M48 family metalloprotease [Saprospiraceae bacterium]